MMMILFFIASGTVAFYLISHPPRRIKKVFKNRLRRFENLFKPLEQLRQGKKVAALFLLSIVSWICNYVSFIALIYQPQEAHFEASLLLLLYTNFGNLIPSSPGALGVIQVAFWMALVPYGFLKEEALAYSFAYQAGLFLFNFAVGLPYFYSAHLKVKTSFRNVVLGESLQQEKE